MYVHYLHITTLYIHSYTYSPTLASHMLTLLSPSMSTFISLNSRDVNITMLALRFVARVVPFVYVPRGTHDFSLPYTIPPCCLFQAICRGGGYTWRWGNDQRVVQDYPHPDELHASDTRMVGSTIKDERG